MVDWNGSLQQKRGANSYIILNTWIIRFHVILHCLLRRLWRSTNLYRAICMGCRDHSVLAHGCSSLQENLVGWLMSLGDSYHLMENLGSHDFDVFWHLFIYVVDEIMTWSLKVIGTLSLLVKWLVTLSIMSYELWHGHNMAMPTNDILFITRDMVMRWLLCTIWPFPNLDQGVPSFYVGSQTVASSTPLWPNDWIWQVVLWEIWHWQLAT